MNNTKAITLSCLFSKEIVNTCTGERLGYICDAEVDMECGMIKCFCTVKRCKGIFTFKKETRKFSLDDIVRIGDDIILVDNCVCCVKNKA